MVTLKSFFQQTLNKLRAVYRFDSLSQQSYVLGTDAHDEDFFKEQIAPRLGGKAFIVIAPGAADAAKRWDFKRFAQVADYFATQYTIVFVGDAADAAVVMAIQGLMRASSITCAGKIDLRSLACVLKHSAWALVHDSGVMHLGSYCDVPLLVLWGPTDEACYGPWSSRAVVVKRNEKCLRCQNPKSKIAHTCMSLITVADVIGASQKLGL